MQGNSKQLGDISWYQLGGLAPTMLLHFLAILYAFSKIENKDILKFAWQFYTSLVNKYMTTECVFLAFSLAILQDSLLSLKSFVGFIHIRVVLYTTSESALHCLIYFYKHTSCIHRLGCLRCESHVHALTYG